MGKRIYASIPVSIKNRDGLISDIKMSLIKLNGELEEFHRVTFSVWRQGDTYRDSLVRDADVLVFMHPDNKFQFSADSLPFGVIKELRIAMNENKKVFLLYKTNAGDLGFYDINHGIYNENDIIQGLPGTSRGLHTYITKKKVAQIGKQPTGEYKSKEVPKLGTDKRLLLTIK